MNYKNNHFFGALQMSDTYNSFFINSRSKNSAKSIIQKKLIEHFKQTKSEEIEFYRHGYVKNIPDNLLSSVKQVDFLDELSSGAGMELKRNFLAIYSSSALAVNSFAPFRSLINHLSLPPPILNNEGINSLNFEKKCPTSLKGTHPHLDVFLTGNNDKIVAIESKLTEIFSYNPNKKISNSYFDDKSKNWYGSEYYNELVRIRDGIENYQFLDATQLIKHAFGLTNTYMKNPKSLDQKITLLYLYWVPANIDSLKSPIKEIYEKHKGEIIKFKKAVDAAKNPSFEAISYPKLWEHWEKTVPENLQKHVKELTDRYLVNI